MHTLEHELQTLAVLIRCGATSTLMHVSTADVLERADRRGYWGAAFAVGMLIGTLHASSEPHHKLRTKAREAAARSLEQIAQQLPQP